jgi:alpha/beta superfamily hydrolase
MTGALWMRTQAIDIRSFFHGFTFGAAIAAVAHLAATDWVLAFVGCHIVFSSIEILVMLDARSPSGERVYSE